MSSLGKFSQFDNLTDASLLNMMIEERQRSIKERAKIFSNHILDLLIYGGINILFAVIFYIGYFNDSIHSEKGQNDSKCVNLVESSIEQAIFHSICSVIYILLPILSYFSAQKDDPKYFNFFKTTNLVFSTISFIAFIVLIGHCLSTILEKEQCGSLRVIFITYVIISICFIIGIIGLILINWIQCDNIPQKKPNSEETLPINQIRDQLKYGSTEQK